MIKATEQDLIPILEKITEEPPLLDLAFYDASSGLKNIYEILDKRFNQGKEIFTVNEIAEMQKQVDEMAANIQKVDVKLTLFLKSAIK